jgi:hypothetical protein
MPQVYCQKRSASGTTELELLVMPHQKNFLVQEEQAGGTGLSTFRKSSVAEERMRMYLMCLEKGPKILHPEDWEVKETLVRRRHLTQGWEAWRA